MNTEGAILFVDDEAIIALEHVQRLRTAGFAVDSAYSAEKALKLLEERPLPDVVLMDINLGHGMDGIEAATIIRRRWKLPVVFFSNSTDPDTVSRARDASPYGYVRKFADEFTLLQAIRTAVALKPRSESSLRAGAEEPNRGMFPGEQGIDLKSELYDLLRADPGVFEFLEQSALDGIWYLDLRDARRAWVSPRFWSTMGYDPARMPECCVDWEEIMDPDHFRRATEALQRHLADPSQPFDEILRYRHADGSSVWVRCRGKAIHDASGEPVRMLGVHNEITQQMRAQEHQRQLLREMNHRIKNNLAILQAMVTIEQGQSDKTKAEALADIDARLRAISAIHDRLSRSQSYEVVSVNDYLTDLACYYAEAAQDEQHPLDVALEVDQVELSTKAASRIGMVVSELLSNTVRHSHPGNGRPQSVSISLVASDGCLYLSYADGGAPPPEVRSLDDLPKGTGLTLIESLTRGMGGELRLKASDTMTFELTVPLSGDGCFDTDDEAAAGD